MTTAPSPIPLDPRDGGALNWFDHVDENFRVTLAFFGTTYPHGKSDRQREAWLIEQLRDNASAGRQHFFFYPLAHKGMALDFQFTRESGPAPGWMTVEGTVPLAQLFLLPNEQPALELARMKEFLTWVDDRVKGQGKDGSDARIQWFRGGYGSRGLEAAGFADDAAREALTQDLKAWHEKPWFERWYAANMKGFAKVRMGPHCWLSMASLVPSRQHAKVWDEIKAAQAAEKATAQATPKP